MEIYVYGTGCGAGELIDSALPAGRVTAFVDERPVSDSFLGRPVIQPEALAGERVDLLIVASRRTDRIESRLRELGVDPEKIFYLKNHVECVDRNRCDALAREVLGDDYVNQICGSERLIRVPLWTVREAVSGPESENDYVRLKTLEAISRRLENVPAGSTVCCRGEYCIFSTPLKASTKPRARDTARALSARTATPRRRRCWRACPSRNGRASGGGCFPVRRRAWKGSALRSSRWTRIWRRVRIPASAGSCRAWSRADICCCTTTTTRSCPGSDALWNAMRRSEVGSARCPCATSTGHW